MRLQAFSADILQAFASPAPQQLLHTLPRPSICSSAYPGNQPSMQLHNLWPWPASQPKVWRPVRLQAYMISLDTPILSGGIVKLID